MNVGILVHVTQADQAAANAPFLGLLLAALGGTSQSCTAWMPSLAAVQAC
jgi:hypothetical protein